MSLEDKIKIAYFKNGPAYATKELCDQVLDFTVGTGSNGGVIGLSGGVDSTVTAYLCSLAFNAYNKENPKNGQLKLLGIIMPSKENDPKDKEYGIRVADLLEIERRVVPIQPISEKYIEEMPDAFPNKNHDVGNLYSEIRATVLSRYGAAKNLRIMGTGNFDEDYVLGYFTKRGDGAVDNNILGNLPKHLVRELGTYLGVPEDIVNKTPTAGLWNGQTDEKELGFTYKQAHIIQRGFDEGKTKEQIAKITGYEKKIIDAVEDNHKITEHKRKVPPVGKVALVYR